MYVDKIDFIKRVTWSDKGLLLSKLWNFYELNRESKNFTYFIFHYLPTKIKYNNTTLTYEK